MSSKPSRVSLVPPPPERGVFKIEKRDDGIMVATPSKGGELASSPSHVHEPHKKQWLPFEGDEEENKSVMSELSITSDTGLIPPTGSIPPTGTGLLATASGKRDLTSVSAKTPPRAPPSPHLTAPSATSKATAASPPENGKDVK